MPQQQLSIVRPRTTAAPPRIGRNVDPHAPRFPGLLYGDVGFGQDMPKEMEVAFLAALALRPKPPLFAWFSKHQQSFVRESYKSSMYEWGEKAGFASATPQFKLVESLLSQLKSEYIFDQLTFDKLSHPPGHPDQLRFPTFETTTTWRHAQFAKLVIRDRLPHLRTTELARPDWVIQRIIGLFRNYIHRLRGRESHPTRDRHFDHELQQLGFAAYESTLYLLSEAQRRPASYRRMIDQRIFDPEHPELLQLPVGDTWATHESRLNARAEHYKKLLDALLETFLKLITRDE